jgi:hypothetical protein
MTQLPKLSGNICPAIIHEDDEQKVTLPKRFNVDD